jgi:DNA polymerase-3 subunit alpha
MLDGAARLNPLFTEAAKMGQPGLAVTDHGNSHAAFETLKAGKAAGIKGIVGVEMYLAPDVPRQHKKPVFWSTGGKNREDVSGAGAYTHMTMWAETTEGMHNMFRMGSHASFDGVYRKPRVDRALLNEYAKGIIATTGCPGGEVQTYLKLGQYDNALRAAGEFRDIFGKDNFFVELMDHGLEVERRTRADLLRLAKDLNLPLVATNDLHYVFKEDAAAHDALLCVQSGAQLADTDRFRFDGSDYYLKSSQEMRHLFKDLPDACDNTLLIAERCNVEFVEGEGRLMPKFPVPDGETEESWFRKEVQRGMEARFPNGIPADRQARADFEMAVIIGKGYPGYFLITADFINWAKSQGIRVGPGRGSGAGSMCAYAMRITDLDPVPYALLFERFLNPERASMPDFDVDFDDQRRGEVIRYVTQKYGTERVAAIVTMGRIKAKQAVKDSAKVLGYPYGLGDQITKAMPPDVMGKGVPLNGGIFNPDHKRYKEAEEFRAKYASEPDTKKVVDTAMGLEGLVRQTGVHAAGVIMSSEPIIDHIPLFMRQSDGQIITGFEYPTCESLGMVKFDFLGLKNLTTIEAAVVNIKANRGIDLVLEDLTLDDPAAFAILASGDTSGVFQVDGSGMKQLLRLMKPDNFEDISAALALYRPGPMGAQSHTNYALRKNGKQKVEPIHRELAEPLAEILGTTHGLIVYQEQVQQIAQKVAGYTLGAADNLRRAMGKKKKEVLDAEFVPFSKGMKDNGFSDECIQALWDILVPFSDYAFNKAHTAAYGLITYWTAYLKANFPAEYMAALLTTNKDDKDKTAIYLNECRRMGIKVLAPDVNDSIGDYAAVGADIRVGMEAVRNVGGNVVASIVNARTSKGAFTDFADFLAKVDATACQKKAVDSLIKAGGFDSLGHTRRALISVAEGAVDAASATKKKEAVGQDSLFGEIADAADLGGVSVKVPDEPEWDKKVLLGFEREMLGLYVTDHPLNGVAHVLRASAETSIGALVEAGTGRPQPVTVGGLLTGISRKVSKKDGSTWAILTVEDLDGSIEMMCFSRTYQEAAHLLTQNAILLFTGRLVEDDKGGIRFAVNSIMVPNLSLDRTADPIVISMPEHLANSANVGALRETLLAHRGQAPVRVRLTPLTGGAPILLALPSMYNVANTPALIGDLKAILGPSCV